ncbi:four helix bundle protein [bacterium]|nr:four helix bundle protein [bacterium]
MMDVEAIAKQEELNQNHIHLYLDGRFYSAFQVSSFLLKHYLWSDLKPLLKHVPKYGDTIRVGFPTQSLTKVLAKADELGFAHTQTENEVIITTPPIDNQVYLRYRQDFLEGYQQIKKQLQLFYGSLPIYKKSYDLFSYLVHLTAKFPKNLQMTLASKIVDLMIEIDTEFYQIQFEQNKNDIMTKISHIDLLFNSVAFLMRLAFDQKAFSLDQACIYTKEIGDIKQQLQLWKKKLVKSSKVSSNS